jgi:hypothetical protein
MQISGITDPSALAALDDAALIANHSLLAEARVRVDAAMAASSAELGRRSRHELGHDGLAQRLGARTPERLVQQLTGVSKGEAAQLLRVGSLRESEAWARTVSVGAADAIQRGLGAPSDDVPASALAVAAATLTSEAPSLTLEQLTARAHELRNDLDEAGVVDRERHLRESRYLRLSSQPDGMVRLSGLLDPESAALVTDAFDAVTTPRRTPRFADPAIAGPALADSALAESAFADAAALAPDSTGADARTTEQRLLDSFVEMVRLAVGADPGALFGDRRPAVRILVAARDLERGAGSAQFEGQSAPVSMATVERHLCATGSVSVLFDAQGQPINVGRSQRLFTSAQRLALAARDGGCRFTGCDRPPSWCEAHHIVPWSRGGPTDIANGILLCRHHHLLVHNNGWGIARQGSDYFLVPPGGGERRPMPSRSRACRALRATA